MCENIHLRFDRLDPQSYRHGVDASAHRELIGAAEQLLRPRQVGAALLGNVAATLLTDSGRQHSGVCIDTPCGTGFCAEHSAIAAMITAGEYRIATIVAVWRDDAGRLYVLPPCGRCRELIRQIDPGNLDTSVVLGSERAVPLRDLLPAHDWPDPLPADVTTSVGRGF